MKPPKIVWHECDPADRHLVHTLCVGEVYGATFPVLDFKTSPGMLVAVALLSCYEIADRVLLYLQSRCEVDDRSPVGVAELAAYLGVNRTSFYRAVAKLQKAGRVSVVGGKVALSASATARMS